MLSQCVYGGMVRLTKILTPFRRVHWKLAFSDTVVTVAVGLTSG